MLLIPFCVVVIDDDPDVLRVVRIKLERAGFRVGTAADAVTGLEMVRRQRPDVAIVDLMLPDRDGLDLVRDLAGLPPGEAPVVLVLSARTGLDEIERGIGAGADDYVTKPFSPRELIERITVTLVRRGRTGPVGGRETASEPGPEPGTDLPIVADDGGEA
ncbi:MAG: response regulator transcription factor [Methanoregulaceae archaeon]